MDGEQQVPGAGRPKKGFWGAVASLFPKRPQALTPQSPTGDAPLEKEMSKVNPGDQETETESVPAGDAASRQPTTQRASSGNGSEPLEGAPDITEAQVPQTNEAAAPNADGEELPPTLAVPGGVKSATLEENEDKPPTLPSAPPASGGSEEDTSTPDPGEPYDPKQEAK